MNTRFLLSFLSFLTFSFLTFQQFLKENTTNQYAIVNTNKKKVFADKNNSEARVSTSFLNLNSSIARVDTVFLNLNSSATRVGTSFFNLNSSTARVGTSFFNINSSTARVGTSFFNINSSTACVGTSLFNLNSSTARVGTSLFNLNSSTARVGTALWNLSNSDTSRTYAFPFPIKPNTHHYCSHTLFGIPAKQFSTFGGMKDGWGETLKSKFKEYQNAIPQEKVYVHLDKPFYKPGENIWGNVYIVNAFTHQASKISDIVYVDLINPQGNVEQSLYLEVKNGVTALNFELPETQTGGLFKIKAYTQWLRNFGEESIFEKDVFIQKVVNPKLLLKLDFEQKGYGSGDWVEANLEALDLANNKVALQKFDFSVQLAGKEYTKQEAETNIDGKAKIKFQLPMNLNSSDGLLNVMVNFEGKSESIARAIPIVLDKIALQFMPEGGDLVYNIASKVAFKALNEFGKPTDIEGILLDDKGNEIQKFSSFHRGMGAFTFTPQAGRSYTAKITKPQKITTTYALPTALQEGYVLGVDAIEKDKIQLHFYASTSTDSIHLIAQNKGEIFFDKSILPQKGINQVAIPIERLDAGIVQITLFDKYKNGRAERLVFVHPDRTMKLSIKTNKPQYQPRELVEMLIEAKDEQGNPVESNISLSVANDQILNVADDKQDNILSYLLMSSDLKGEIDEPNFYFKKDDAKATQALDYVMLTHGWRRFTWQEVMKQQHYVKYLPEKNGIVSGHIVDASTMEPVSGTVMLFEMSGKNRALRIETASDGKFSFINIVPDTPLQIFARSKKGKKQMLYIVLDEYAQKHYLSYHTNQIIKQNQLFELDEIVINSDEASKYKTDIVTNPLQAKTIKEEVSDELSVAMTTDVANLSEVVVVGYASVEKKEVTGSVVYVNAREQLSLIDNSLSNALAGKMSGIIVGSPSDNTKDNQIRIRGTSSFTNRSSPLYVLNGMLMSDISNMDAINPENIESVTVLKGAEATAMYGARAVNGVIAIETKKELASRGYYYDPKPIQSPYTGIYLDANGIGFAKIKEFYAPKYTSQSRKRERTDFRNTIYWNPNIKTDKNGQAKVSFYTSDDLTTFRITAEGISQQGNAGREESTFANNLPLNMDTQIPAYLSVEDTLYIPLYFKNNTAQAIKGKAKIKTSAAVKLLQSDEIEVHIAPQGNQTFYIACTAIGNGNKEIISIAFESNVWDDVLTQTLEIQPKGFPTEIAISGNQASQAFQFNIPQHLKGSLQAEFVAYPNLLNDLIAGMEGVFREPYGCFEQVSSSTFPNILALQFLKETNRVNPEVQKKALHYIQEGYKKLAAYETREGGFEWYGKTPPHEGLTAFGLLEFTEMQKVYDGVSQNMINRTKKWLLDRRDGKGGFDRNAGKYGFSGASAEVTNSYIVYALSAVGEKNIDLEYQTAFQEANKREDAYRMALVANAALNLNKEDDAQELLKKLHQYIEKQGFDMLKADHSLVRSYGNSLLIETASLIGMAELKTTKPNMKFLTDLIQYLSSKRSYGMFGSTQGTILALQFLTKYAQMTKNNGKDGEIQFMANGVEIFSQAYSADAFNVIKLSNWQDKIGTGNQRFAIQFKGNANPIPFSIQLKWNSYTPNSNKECQVDLRTDLSANTVKLNETVRLTTTLTNRSKSGLPMTVALIGIPSGLSVQPWQLKEIQEKGIVDFYEIKQNYVVFYYRELAPQAIQTIHLDLQAKVPGNYQAPAASAYLYYTNEYKDWEAGEQVKVIQ